MDDDNNSMLQSTIGSYNTLHTMTNISGNSTVTNLNHFSDEAVSNRESAHDTDLELQDPSTVSNGDRFLPSTDPFNIKQLALNFDYLVYKINDRIQMLSDKTYGHTLLLKNSLELKIQEIDTVIIKFHEVLRELDQINQELNKLQQLDLIILEFKPRILELERFFFSK